MERVMYDVFISYSRKDYVDEHKNVIPGNEVSKIKEALTQAGITYWFDENGVYAGDEFARLIARNIKASKVFVFLSTVNSNESEWTADEISTAHMLKKKIIPVRIDDSVYHEDVILYLPVSAILIITTTRTRDVRILSVQSRHTWLRKKLLRPGRKQKKNAGKKNSSDSAGSRRKRRSGRNR